MKMNLKNIKIAYHRNGISGNGFYVSTFDYDNRKMFAIVFFSELGSCAVLDIGLLSQGDITFGSNSWRGDWFEDELREAIQKYEEEL